MQTISLPRHSITYDKATATISLIASQSTSTPNLLSIPKVIRRNQSRVCVSNPMIVVTEPEVKQKIRNEIGTYHIKNNTINLSSYVHSRNPENQNDRLSMSTNNLKFEEFDEKIKKKIEKNAKRCSLKIIQLRRRGMEGKLISSIRDQLSEEAKIKRSKIHLKNKLWLSSINPVRATILNVYKKNQERYFRFYECFNILKQALLSLSLQIYFSTYCKDILAKQFRIICDNKKTKQFQMLSNEINYIDEIIEGKTKSRNFQNTRQCTFIKNTFNVNSKRQKSIQKKIINKTLCDQSCELPSISMTSTDFSMNNPFNKDEFKKLERGDAYKGMERMVINQIKQRRKIKVTKKKHIANRSLFNAQKFMYLTKDNDCTNKGYNEFCKDQSKNESKSESFDISDDEKEKKKKKPNALTVFKSSLKHAIVKTKKGFLGCRGETLKG